MPKFCQSLGRMALLPALVSRWNVRQVNVHMCGGHYSVRAALCITFGCGAVLISLSTYKLVQIVQRSAAIFQKYLPSPSFYNVLDLSVLEISPY